MVVVLVFRTSVVPFSVKHDVWVFGVDMVVLVAFLCDQISWGKILRVPIKSCDLTFWGNLAIEVHIDFTVQ